MPRVSVLLPVFNEQEQYLREAISSILHQRYQDFEFIIINDGSTNNSEDVILSYNDNRIIYVKNERNVGITQSLNKGLDIARGEYLVRMDSDDIAREDRLQVQVDFMDNHPEIIAAGTYANQIPDPLKYEGPITTDKVRNFNRYITNCILHSAMIIRLNKMKEFNIRYDKNYPHTEDYKLCIDLNKYGEITNIPEVLLLRRVHPQSITSQNGYIQMKFAIKILMENIIEDFGEEETEKLKYILQKYMNNQELTLREYLAVDALLYRAAKKVFTIITPEYHWNIREVYSNVRNQFAYQTKPSEGLLSIILFSKLNKVLTVKKIEKFQLMKNITERMITDEEEKLKPRHVFG